VEWNEINVSAARTPAISQQKGLMMEETCEPVEETTALSQVAVKLSYMRHIRVLSQGRRNVNQRYNQLPITPQSFRVNR